MVKSSLYLVAASLLWTPGSAAVGFDLESFTSLVVFGDSYTDQGIYSYIPNEDGTLPNPSENTSTGGRAWPQYIKQYSGANVYDYAISGAVCDNVMALGQRKGIKQHQVPAFLGDNEWVNSTSGQPALDNPSDETVYAVWIGTNDLGNGVFLTERQPKGLSITAYTDCVFEQLDRLYEVGARNFIVMNLAPLDLLPQYALPENDGVEVSRFWQDKLDYNANITQTSEKTRQYTNAANEIYKMGTPYQVVIQQRYSESTFAVFDVHSLITKMWEEPADYFNGTAPLNTTGFVTACKDSTCADKSDWDSFLWYDELHPSEQADRIIAEEFLQVVNGTSSYAEYWQG